MRHEPTPPLWYERLKSRLRPCGRILLRALETSGTLYVTPIAHTAEFFILQKGQEQLADLRREFELDERVAREARDIPDHVPADWM